MRSEVPGICLRTTMMVGFPGEGDKEFEELLEFVKWAKFDRLGAFAYCEEDGTYAAENYRDSVSRKKKQERLDRLMEVQQRISSRLNDEKVGKVFRTVIDRVEGDYYIGRTEFDSPDVDTEVLVDMNEGSLEIGHFYNVRITDATEFDLMGSVVEQ
jgi:ribosomal protein S12 methylthiotransferase